MPDNIDVTVATYPRDEVMDYEELHQFIDKAIPSDEPYVVVAESFSGPLAIEHASARPDNLRAVVLCASFVENPLPICFRWIRLFVNQFLLRIPLSNWAVRYLLLGRDSSDELVDSVRHAISSVYPAVLSQRIKQSLSLRVGHLMPEISSPLLYLAGSRDRIVGKRGLSQISALCPGAISSVLDGPHLLIQRRPDQVLERIFSFLQQDSIR